jgi:leucyl aminopeptidase
MSIGVICMAAMLTLSSASPKRVLLIPDRANTLVKAFSGAEVLYREGDAAVVRVDDHDVEAWSKHVHDEFGACGGFIDVSHEVASGVTGEQLVSREFFGRTLLSTFEAPELSFDQRIADLIASSDKDRMWSFLETLTKFDDRSASTDSGTKAANYIAEEAAKTSESVQVFKVATRGYPKQPSVVASLPGTDPSLPRVVIGGHMDTLSSNKPGADDDGTGSALVMEALRSITEKGVKFKHTIDFMWYAAEERGLVGSSTVVDHYKTKGVKVKAAIQFDMTGFKSPKEPYDNYLIQDNTNSALNTTLQSMASLYLPDVTFGKTSCGYACSDHASWHRGGIPATFPFESTFKNSSRVIHTANDKMEFLDQIHANNFLDVGLGLLGVVAEIAE